MAQLSELIPDTSREKQYLVILTKNILMWKLIDAYLQYKKVQFLFLKCLCQHNIFYSFVCNYVVAWRYNILILILLVYYIAMSVVDAFMPELYFESSYFCKEFFVVQAYDHFKISKKKNQQSVYCGGFFLYLPCFYLERHGFELVFSIFLSSD